MGDFAVGQVTKEHAVQFNAQLIKERRSAVNRERASCPIGFIFFNMTMLPSMAAGDACESPKPGLCRESLLNA